MDRLRPSIKYSTSCVSNSFSLNIENQSWNDFTLRMTSTTLSTVKCGGVSSTWRVWIRRITFRFNNTPTSLGQPCEFHLNWQPSGYRFNRYTRTSCHPFCFCSPTFLSISRSQILGSLGSEQQISSRFFCESSRISWEMYKSGYRCLRFPFQLTEDLMGWVANWSCGWWHF